MRRSVPNLLIVGGDGRNSGKTAMICRILLQLSNCVVVPVKISPHFHEPSPGLNLLTEEDGYKVFEETNLWSAKDTSRMLQIGAAKVLYSQATDEKIGEAFERIERLILAGTPIICESPALIRHVDPGIFVMMKGSDKPAKDIREIEAFTHIRFTIEELDRTVTLPFLFENGKWKIQ